MQVKVSLSELEIKDAIARYIAENVGVKIEASAVVIEVKSKQNFKSEWEQAAIRCEFTAHKIDKD